MKLRTSFFNPAVLKKDITRFAPVWGLYSVCFLLGYISILNGGYRWAAESVAQLCNAASTFQLIYGGICAAMLFGDLFNSRLCNALHAMPLRREGWFLNKLAAGLLFFLVPTGLFSLALIPLCGAYWYVPLIFLAVSFLSFLFFFGTGAFCALCAGNRLGMVALFAIVHLLPVLVRGVVYVFWEPFLFGIPLDMERFTYYSPAFALVDPEFLKLSYIRDTPSYIDTAQVVWEVQVNWEAWAYLGWTSLTAVVFLGLTLFLYCRRDLETAGDFLSFRWGRPVFLGIYCLVAGVLPYLLGEALDEGVEYIFLVVGLAVGFFTGRMLLDRTVRVFKGKTFLAFGLTLAVLGISMGAVAADLFGVVRRVPQAQQVEQVQLSTRYGAGAPVVLTEPEDIGQILQIHETCLERRGSGNGDFIHVELQYTLKNGGTLTRAYPVPLTAAVRAELNRHFSSWQCVFETDDWEDFCSRVRYVQTDFIDDKAMKLADTETRQLLEAIRRDCDAGNMSQIGNFHWEEDTVYWIQFGLAAHNDPYLDQYLTLEIYESCENTLAFLEQHGIE